MSCRIRIKFEMRSKQCQKESKRDYIYRLPWEEVWTPDIVLYNAAGDGEQGREMRTLIQVTSRLDIFV